MKLRLGGLAVLAVLGGIAVLAATGLGEGSGRGPEGKPRELTAQRVSAPSAGAPKAVTASGAGGPKLIYKETVPTPVDNGAQGFEIGKCPRRSNAINGYYLPADFNVLLEGTGPSLNLRKWELFIDNSNLPGPTDVVFGIVCLKL